MSVGPPNWWLLNRMVHLTNNTLEIIEKNHKKVLGNILNNDNTITGSNSFTGDNVFTGDNTFEGKGDFTTLEADYIQSQSVRVNTISCLPVLYEVDWISNDNGTFTITYNIDTLQLYIASPTGTHLPTINPSEYLLSVIGISDINDLVGLTITLTNYTNSSLAEEPNPLSATYNIIGINTGVDYILQIQLDSSLPNATLDYGDHTFEGTIVLTALINSNEIDVNANLNLSENNISANLGNFTNIIIDGNLSGNTQLNIEGNLVINGQTTFNGNIISNNTLNIESNVSINNSLIVNDASTFNQTLNIKKGGITLGNTSRFDGNVIFNGNVTFDGNIISNNTLSIESNVSINNSLTVNDASTFNQSLNVKNGGITLGNTSRFDGNVIFYGNIISNNTLRGNTIESAGTDKITFNSNIAVPFLFGNVSGNTANLTDSVSAPLLIGNVSGNLSGTTANLTYSVSAPLLIGNLQGNITGSQNVHVTADQFIIESTTQSYLRNFLTLQSSGAIVIGSDTKIIDTTGNITTNSILPIGENITLTANIVFDSATIQSNTTSTIQILGAMGGGWFPLMYNQSTKQLAYGPPPYS